MREIHKNIKTLFKPYEWKVVETDYNWQNNKNNESIFTIGNGYLGVRGFYEEGFYGDKIHSDTTTLINGIYEYFPYHHIWERPGFPSRYHSIINQANPFDVKIYIDNELVILGENVTDYARTLDFKTKKLIRTFKYKTKTNKIVSLEFRRFASQTDKHNLMQKITFSANDKVDVELITSLTMPTNDGSIKEEIGTLNSSVYNYLNASRSNNVLSL